MQNARLIKHKTEIKQRNTKLTLSKKTKQKRVLHFVQNARLIKHKTEIKQTRLIDKTHTTPQKGPSRGRDVYESVGGTDGADLERSHESSSSAPHTSPPPPLTFSGHSTWILKSLYMNPEITTCESLNHNIWILFSRLLRLLSHSQVIPYESFNHYIWILKSLRVNP